MNPYYLVKVTDKQWADKLLDGDIFMRPLSEFGDLLRRDPGCSNNFRGDILEGVSHSFSSKDDSSFFRDAIGGEETQPKGMGQFAECFLQERVFSLYCLEYSEDLSSFIEPDRRLRDFGDTAVIIVDPAVFLRRIFDVLKQQYIDLFWAGAKRVEYFVDLTKLAEYDEFTKHDSYSWQNEYRLALDLNTGLADLQAWEGMTDACKAMFLSQGGRVSFHAERKPIVLKIGDIRDACITIPTWDLIDLRFPSDERLNHIQVPPPLMPPRKAVVTTYRPVMVW